MGGVRYGRLVGIAFSHTSASGRAHWLLACGCGNEVVADGGNVRFGSTSSCGCLHREISAARLTTHGRRAAKLHDPTYRAWQEINTICFNPQSPRYRDFGARAIAVCPGWSASFEAFLSHMGERPTGKMLTRLNEREEFGPENCRWSPVPERSTRAKQGHRRRSKR